MHLEYFRPKYICLEINLTSLNRADFQVLGIPILAVSLGAVHRQPAAGEVESVVYLENSVCVRACACVRARVHTNLVTYK